VFSQEKYKAKKKRIHCSRVTAYRPASARVCAAFFSKVRTHTSEMWESNRQRHLLLTPLSSNHLQSPDRIANMRFDALWLESYGDETQSRGRVAVRAGLQRSVEGARVVLIDEVMDSGLSLCAAERIVRDAGAASVIGCIFARKPWPEPREFVPEVVAWEAPARFLAGYGMDLAGRWRGVPDVVALD
jgi:phosphoribosylpyrophosphate synthetase